MDGFEFQRKTFETFENTDFVDSGELISPMLHLVCLVWANSCYYGTNARMVILFKMISNMMIAEATKSLDPGSLFQGEVDECLVKVGSIIDILEFYK